MRAAWRGLGIAAAFGLALWSAGPALAADTVEVRLPGGQLRAAGGVAPFAYPADGSLVRVRMASIVNGNLVLRGVSLLDGAVAARELVIPARGFNGASVDGLSVAGRARGSRPNTLVALGRAGYVVALQEAVTPGQDGMVGLRLHLTSARGDLPAGSELLIGLPVPPSAGAGAGAVDAATAAPDPGGVLALAPSPLLTDASPGARLALAWALDHVGHFFYSQGSSTDRGSSVGWMQTHEPAGPSCDCSMFARWALAQAGLDVGWTTVDQWYARGLLPNNERPASAPQVSRGVGPRPPANGYQPGDMIFWGHGPGNDGHVALYLGAGLIVQCSGGADGSNVHALETMGLPTGWVRWRFPAQATLAAPALP